MIACFLMQNWSVVLLMNSGEVSRIVADGTGSTASCQGMKSADFKRL